MVLSFIVFELFLMAMHFTVLGFFGHLTKSTSDVSIGGFDLNNEATIAV